MPKTKPEPISEARLGIRIDSELLHRVKTLALRRSHDEGRRVTVTELTEEAYRDLLKKYPAR